MVVSPDESVSVKYPGPASTAGAAPPPSAGTSPAQPTTPAPTPAKLEPKLYRLGDLLREFTADAHEAHEAYLDGRALGPVSQFAALDALIGGAFRPGLHIMHGGPGTGKTAFALQVAAMCGTPALFVSCEISMLEIMRRMAARVSGTYLGRFKTGELLPEAAERYAMQACAVAPLLALVDGTAAFPGIPWIAQQAEAIRGDARHILVVVDSLHTWANRGNTKGQQEYDMLNAALSGLEQLAGRLHAPVLAIAERSRSTMRTGGMNAAKGTSRVEYAGETVLGLNTEYDDDGNPAQPDMHGERSVWLTVEKNRHGEKDRRINLKFHGALQRFSEDR